MYVSDNQPNFNTSKPERVLPAYIRFAPLLKVIDEALEQLDNLDSKPDVVPVTYATPTENVPETVVSYSNSSVETAQREVSEAYPTNNGQFTL